MITLDVRAGMIKCEELNKLVTIKTIGDLTFSGGNHYVRDKQGGSFTIFQQAFTE